MLRRILTVVLVVSALTAGSHAQSKRFITEQDLFKFTWIADPQISPDGSTIVYVNVTVNEKKDGYESALFVMPAIWIDAAATADVRHARHLAALGARRHADRLRAGGGKRRQGAAGADLPARHGGWRSARADGADARRRRSSLVA
jgi:hypothetical protein